MRICIFAKPDAVHTGRVVAALRQRGFQVHLIFTDQSGVSGASYERFAVPPLNLRHPLRRDVRRYRYLRDIFDKHDVVTTFFLHHWALDRESVGDGCLVVWPWGSDVCPPPVGPAPSEATLRRRRTMLRAGTSVNVCGHWFAEKVANFAAIPRSSINVTPLGVDTDRFRPPTAQCDETIVGFMKGFGYAYGSTDWIRAIPLVLNRVPSARFEMIGDGPLRQECQVMAQQLGVSHAIRWIAPQPHHRVAEIINRWSVSVMPSLCESFGVAALESSACGVPVVATAVGGFRETVEPGRTGFLVAAGDPSDLSESVVKLLLDKELRRFMGDNGRRMVMQRFEWNDCADRWADSFIAATVRAANSPLTDAPNRNARAVATLAGAAT